MGWRNTCWAHSAMASIEGYLIKKGMATSDIDLAERALCYFFFDLDGIDDPKQNTYEDVNKALLPFNNKYNIYQLGGKVTFKDQAINRNPAKLSFKVNVAK